MNMQPYTPEGWNYNTSCDENYNLHVNLGNGIKAIMPRNEIEAINANSDGCPRESLCTGKVNKFVQFRIKEMNQNGDVIISRKDVQKDALNWIKLTYLSVRLCSRKKNKNLDVIEGYIQRAFKNLNRCKLIRYVKKTGQFYCTELLYELFNNR